MVGDAPVGSCSFQSLACSRRRHLLFVAADPRRVHQVTSHSGWRSLSRCVALVSLSPAQPPVSSTRRCRERRFAAGLSSSVRRRHGLPGGSSPVVSDPVVHGQRQRAWNYLRHGVSASFQALAFGNRTLGFILVALFAANLIWRLRKGPRNARHELSWCAALLVWWLGLVHSREGTDALVFRYELVGSAFVILGSLPAHRPPGPGGN